MRQLQLSNSAAQYIQGIHTSPRFNTDQNPIETKKQESLANANVKRATAVHV